MLTQEQDVFLDHRLIHFTSGCWQWIGALNHGYASGSCPDIRKNGPVHRYAYRLWKGPIGEGLQIDHLCRNRACVNPSHLEAVTGSENQRRQGALVTHCPKGHEYTEANTKRTAKGRVCRACANLYQKAHPEMTKLACQRYRAKKRQARLG